MKLRNDKILVFGGGSGIGKAIAKRFCDAGAKVLITGRNEEKLKNAAQEINSKNIYYKAFDITNINGKAPVITTLALRQILAPSSSFSSPSIN